MGLPIICIDFDGVLHSYTSGWQGADVASDLPVPGAIEWLIGLAEGGKVYPVIYSSRSKDVNGVFCMQHWLVRHGMPRHMVEALEFPTQKPPAFLTIDDRAMCFEGKFPTVQEIHDFRPWNKRPPPDDGWLPIETLPNTSDLVLAWAPHASPIVGAGQMIWAGDLLTKHLQGKHPHHLTFRAQRWRPLPPSPQRQEARS